MKTQNPTLNNNNNVKASQINNENSRISYSPMLNKACNNVEGNKV